MKTRYILIGVAFSMVMLFSGCTTSTAKEGVEAWTFIEEVIGEPQTLDPASAYDTASGNILEQVYETLFFYEYGKPDSIIPKLAKDMPEWTTDGLKCTIDLRKDVTFHDGTEFNATAVKASYDHIVLVHDPGGPDWMFSFLKGANTYMGVNMTTATDAEAETAANIYQWGPDATEGTDDDDQAAVYMSGDYQVILTLEEPYVAFTAIMAYSIGSILSPTFLAAHADTPGEINTHLEENMVGTGPYKFVEWSESVHVKLALYEDYWNLPKSHYPPTEVLVKLVEDVNPRLAHLQAGDAHAIDLSSADLALVWNQLTETEINPASVNVSIGHATWAVANFAMNQRVYPYNVTEFRQAMCYAFPYETYIDETINGLGRRMRGVIPYGMFGYTDNAYNYEYSQTEAAAKLTASGVLDDYTVANPLQINISYNTGNTNREAACQLLKTNVEEISEGLIEITINEMAWSQILDALDALELSMWLIGWAPDYADPDDYIQPYYGGTGSVVEGYYTRRTGYNNSQINDWIIQARSESDSTTRASLYQQIEQQAATDAIYIHLYEATGLNVKSPLIHNWKPNPMTAGYYYMNLWLEVVEEADET